MTHPSTNGILASAIRLPCGAVLPNRIAKSAMSETLASSDGLPSDKLIRLYDRFARGGAGLLITGNVIVTPGGISEHGNVILGSQQPIEPFQRWAAAATRNGTRCFVQLNHSGRQAPCVVNRHPVAPSAIRHPPAMLFAKPRELTLSGIDEIVAAFASGAAFVQRAGFSGVQIHGAHGYLISQFLSPRSNHRTDGYGGSLDNRIRFLLECYRAIRVACGPEFPISVKLNSADFLRGGFEPDEAVAVARRLDQEGIDLLEISGGTYESPSMFVTQKESTLEREAHFLEYAKLIRAAVNCPLMLTGGIRTPEVMAGVVANDAIDVIGLARPIALEPDLPREILAGRTAPSTCQKVEGHQFTATVDASWYRYQLHRMASGSEPDPSASRIATIAAMMRSYLSC